MVEAMTIHSPHMLPKIRSKAIMAAANGSPCTLRIASFFPGHRCASDDTTVACHLPIWGKGVSTKVTDMAVAFGCIHCHDILDGRNKLALAYIEEKYPRLFYERLMLGLTETHALLIQRGLIIIPDAKELV
jgi:hypothetical protein